MFKQITNLDGGEIYLITSLLLFMVFFLIVGVYLIKLSKNHIQVMSSLPFDDHKSTIDEKD